MVDHVQRLLSRVQWNNEKMEKKAIQKGIATNRSAHERMQKCHH